MQVLGGCTTADEVLVVLCKTWFPEVTELAGCFDQLATDALI